jgi:hypothetical protein
LENNAVADHSTDPLLKEIADELRDERLARLWRRYGNWLIGAALLLVVAAAGHQGWKSYQASQREQASVRYAAAVRLVADANAQAAEKAFAEIAASAPAGYAMLARFREAQLAAKQGDATRAADLYRRLAADSSLDRAYRDLAQLLAAYAVADRADPKALRQEIAKLGQPDSSWRFLARELSALLSLRAGDRDIARDELRRLADDPDAPATIKARAHDAAAQIDKALGKAPG